MSEPKTFGPYKFDPTVPFGVPSGTFTAAAQPKTVGYWKLGFSVGTGTKFAMYSKPTDEQIKNTEALLGWEWEDAK